MFGNGSEQLVDGRCHLCRRLLGGGSNVVWDCEWFDFNCEMWHSFVEMGSCDASKNSWVLRRCNGLEGQLIKKLKG